MYTQENMPRIIDCQHFVIKDNNTEITVSQKLRNVKYYELDYNLESGRNINIDGREYTVDAGSIIFRHPGQSCSSFGSYNMFMLTFDWGNDDIANVKYIRNYSSSHNDNPLTENKLNLPDIFIPEHSSEILSIYRRLSVLWRQKERKELTNLYMCRLINLVCSDAATHRIHQLEKSTPVDKALSYISTHYMEDLTLEKLADILHLNKYYLIRLFKNETGHTPNDFIIGARLEQAKRLLACTDLSVLEISQQCGFDSSSYFCRRFRKAFNTTPAKYRNARIT